MARTEPRLIVAVRHPTQWTLAELLLATWDLAGRWDTSPLLDLMSRQARRIDEQRGADPHFIPTVFAQ